MNLTTLTETLFDKCAEKAKQAKAVKTVKKNTTKTTSNFNREASTIEYQLNQHLSQKHTKSKKSGNHEEYKRVSFTKLSGDCHGFDEFIEKEKSANRQKGKSWNAMNACDQWSLIKQYYETQNSPYDLVKVKKLYHNKVLDITYSQTEKIITNIACARLD